MKHIQDKTDMCVLYYFCSSSPPPYQQCNDIFRNLAAQILVPKPDLAPYIIDQFANEALTPTIKNLETIIKNMILDLPAVRILVDGLDERPKKEQEEILNRVLKLKEGRAGACKVAISSRLLPFLSERLSGVPTLRLEEHPDHVKRAIACFVPPRLARLRHRYRRELIDDLERSILQKADGKRYLFASILIV